MRRRPFALVLLALGLGGTISGCGRVPEATPARPSHPSRILPANTAAAEFLATILGKQGASRLAALPEQVDAYSSLDFRSSPWSEIPRFARYQPEPLIALHPDLVVTHAWQAADTTAFLRAQGISVVVLASARGYEEIRGSIEALGTALGTRDEASKVIAELDARIAALRANASHRSDLRVLEYSNNGTGGWTAGKDTTADAMIGLAGMRNAATEAGLAGHANLDAERLLAIDPDVIVVGAPARDDVGSPTQAVLEGTSAFALLSAVKARRIVVLPASLLSSDSPCLLDAAERLASAVDSLLAQTPSASDR